MVEDNVSGLLAQAGDANALARAVEKLIQNPEQRLAMGRASQARAHAHFSADVIVPQYESLYWHLCCGIAL